MRLNPTQWSFKLKPSICATLELFVLIEQLKMPLCSALHLGSMRGRQENLLYVKAVIGFSFTTKSAINVITLHCKIGWKTIKKGNQSQNVKTHLTVHQTNTAAPLQSNTCQRRIMLQNGGTAEQQVTRYCRPLLWLLGISTGDVGLSFVFSEEQSKGHCLYLC